MTNLNFQIKTHVYKQAEYWLTCLYRSPQPPTERTHLIRVSIRLSNTVLLQCESPKPSGIFLVVRKQGSPRAHLWYHWWVQIPIIETFYIFGGLNLHGFGKICYSAIACIHCKVNIILTSACLFMIVCQFVSSFQWTLIFTKEEFSTKTMKN